MDHSDDTDDRADRVKKAMAHPLRARVLTLVHERGPISRAALARDHDVGDLGTIGYHVGVLEQLNAVECTESRPDDGPVEYLYETTPFGEEVAREIEENGGPPAADG